MAGRVEAVEVFCDGRKGCRRAFVMPPRRVRAYAAGQGWLLTPDIDLCPDCRHLPQFAPPGRKAARDGRS